MVTKKFLLIALITFTVFGRLQAQDDTTKYKTETIEVNSIRAIDRLTPITYENIRHDKIQ